MWKDTVLKRVEEGKGNTPGGQTTRCGVLVSRFVLTHELILMSSPSTRTLKHARKSMTSSPPFAAPALHSRC
jgi:hypothetical protein